MKKRVKADVQMVREYLNVIKLSLRILILQFYHLLHKLMLYSICSLAPNQATSISGCRPSLYRVKKIERTTLKVIVSLSFISYLFVYLVYLNFFKLHSLINSSYNVHSQCTKLTQDSVHT